VTVTPSTDFLVRAAREFLRGGWVFTGFHWPVLAGQLAYALNGKPFTQVFEAGSSCHEAGRLVPTSTTDYPAYGNAIGYSGGTADVLLAMARRFDRVVLDASNVDILGRVNSSYVGDRDRPKVRLPGGGGSADIAAVARELVWLHGSEDLGRIQRRVEHVTANPGPDSLVRLHTRWGIVRLGAELSLEELAPDTPGAGEFVQHLESLGACTAGCATREAVRGTERQAAAEVLRLAAARGYAVARRALHETEDL